MMRDAEFGPVRIRAYGVYSYRITDPATFLRQIVGTDGLFTTDEINSQLKKQAGGQRLRRHGGPGPHPRARPGRQLHGPRPTRCATG